MFVLLFFCFVWGFFLVCVGGFVFFLFSVELNSKMEMLLLDAVTENTEMIRRCPGRE